ncbi:MAG: sensor histidine kinase [Acidobacteriaceae bacterium]|nr:sensor histidine kinase [Acidobacteriaceae bacterium]
MRIVPPRPRMRVLLWTGFGGLLTLLVFTAISALSVVRQVQIRNDKIRSDYIERTRLLEQLRSDTYLSGTYVRDFLSEPDDAKADSYREEFFRRRESIERAISQYRAMLRPGEAGTFNSLARGLAEYFGALQPALAWSAAQRKNLGRSFMHDQVLQRRMTMINLADKVSEVNERQLETGNALIRELFAEFRQRLLALFLITVTIGILLSAISMQRIFKLEQEAGERYREMVHARREAQELSARVVDAQEAERRAIARELHDEVGQSLSALLLAAGNLATVIPPDGNPKMSSYIQQIRMLAEKSVSVVRNVSLLLRPSMLDDLGLVPALQWQARETSRSTGIRVSVAADDIGEDLPDEYKTTIYRIVQEALHNCQKHSQAQRVRIELKQTDDRLLLSIQDDGRGFRPEHRGFGLLGMEERINRLGGEFHISSEEGSGTLLSIELRKPAANLQTAHKA